MKLTKEQLKPLLTKHIYSVTKEGLEALCFLFGTEISNYKKTNHFVSFIFTHLAVSVIVECRQNSNVSMGKKKGKTVSFGGVFSFSDIFDTFHTFYSREIEVTFCSTENGPYTAKERTDLVCEAMATHDRIQKEAMKKRNETKKSLIKQYS